jgi:hypothetical protein
MSPPGAKGFPTTSWSLIRRAANLEAQESRAALASLCEAYWEPLYAGKAAPRKMRRIWSRGSSRASSRPTGSIN